jgi:hypothetical protein
MALGRIIAEIAFPVSIVGAKRIGIASRDRRGNGITRNSRGQQSINSRWKSHFIIADRIGKSVNIARNDFYWMTRKRKVASIIAIILIYIVINIATDGVFTYIHDFETSAYAGRVSCKSIYHAIINGVGAWLIVDIHHRISSRYAGAIAKIPAYDGPEPRRPKISPLEKRWLPYAHTVKIGVNPRGLKEVETPLSCDDAIGCTEGVLSLEVDQAIANVIGTSLLIDMVWVKYSKITSTITHIP